MRICKIEGCGKKYYSIGYCRVHYCRMYKTGSTEILGIISPEKRFFSKILKHKSGCHIFIGSRSKDGYGNLRIGDKIIKTHRYAWFLKHGKWPSDNIKVCHKCDNPPCCNPDHLFLGTDKDNVRDSIKKGRFKRAFGEGHGMAIFSEQDILYIRKVLKEGKKSGGQLAREYGVWPSLISKIRNRLLWKHV